MALSPLTQAAFYHTRSGWLPICVCLPSHYTEAQGVSLSLLSTNAHDSLGGVHFVNPHAKGDKNGKFHSSAAK